MGASSSKSKAGPMHRSLNCRVATTIEFVNSTEHTVETVWLDYQGGGKAYFSLAPGERVSQPTFTAHPWVFRAPHAPSTTLVVGDQQVFYAPPVAEGSPPHQARIVAAGSVPWSVAHHHQFPASFRAQAAALLCCHHRLCKLQPDGSACSTPRCRSLAHHLQRQGSRLRQLLQSPPMCRQQAQAAAAAGRAFTLGDLPKDLIMHVLEAAAPTVPFVLHPAQPHGVAPEELAAQGLEQLFRQTQPKVA